MYKRKLLVGLMTSSVSLAIAFSGSASAANTFRAEGLKTPVTPGTPGIVKGTSLGEQELKFGPFKISCESAHAKSGIANAESATFFAKVKFAHCSTYFTTSGQPLGPYPAKITPVEFEFHQNHYAELGSEGTSEVSLKNAGEVIASVASTKCEIYWEPQTVPAKAEKHPEDEYSLVAYSNTTVPTTKLRLFPSGFQHDIVITAALKKIFTYVEGGKCEEFAKEEWKNGEYHGALRFELKQGNLFYEEPVV